MVMVMVINFTMAVVQPCEKIFESWEPTVFGRRNATPTTLHLKMHK